jgi:aspartate racemase
MSDSPRLLGVLGGMGPAATADFLSRLVALTPAEADRDHIPVVVSSVPQIPDRTEAILGEGLSPLPALLTGLERLERAGADLIVMPCNTAHHWHADLAAARPNLSWIHIVDAVLALAPAGARLGLLATTGTLQAGIYPLRAPGRTFVAPEPAIQSGAVMRAIRAVKSGRPGLASEPFLRAAHGLRAKGATHLVFACTEVALGVPDPGALGLPPIDSTEALARAVIQRFGLTPRTELPLQSAALA